MFSIRRKPEINLYLNRIMILYARRPEVKSMIYMDNAATTLRKPVQVKEAVLAALDTMGNAGRGASDPALDASRVIYGTREKLAGLFHAESPSRIVFTANSTESLNIAIKGLCDPGDHVITTVLEHNSVLRPLYECRERGTALDDPRV